MIQCAQHACMVLISSHTNRGMLPDLRHQIFFQCSFDPWLHISFLFHDPAAQDHTFRIDHKADIGNAHPQKLRQAVQFLTTDEISRLCRLKDPESIPDFRRLSIF